MRAVSGARAALIGEAQPGPVAELLRALNDPSLLELRRLREELARLETEARELERRLRASIRGTRGLRGLGVSVNGSARSLDLFPSGRAFSEALPRLLRMALLEAALARRGPSPMAGIVSAPWPW